NQRCHPSPSASKLKAAPGLYSNVKSKNGKTWTRSPYCSAASKYSLVIWSATTMPKAATSHPIKARVLPLGWPVLDVSGMTARLAIAVQIVNAAAADGCVFGIHPNVRPVVPASFAFGVFSGAHFNASGAICGMNAGPRHDKNEAQVVFQGSQCGQVVPAGIDIDLRI